MILSKQYIISGKLLSELLQRLRGKRTQNALSRKLGYDFNQVYRWESCRTRIKWSEFVSLCAACKVDLKSAIHQSSGDYGKIERSDLLLKRLLGEKNLSRMSTEFKLPYSSLYKWTKGISEPPANTILGILNEQDLLFVFLKHLIGDTPLDCLKSEFEKKTNEVNLYYNHPESGAVVTCLDLKEYQSKKSHDPELIASKVGISSQQVNSLLSKLARAGIVEKKSGKYRRLNNWTSTRGSYEGEKRIREYWTLKGVEKGSLQRFRDTEESFGYILLSVNQKMKQQIKECAAEFSSRIAEISRQDPDNADEILVMTLQMFNPSVAQRSTPTRSS